MEYQPNNGMSPAQFAAWIAAMPAGEKAPPPGSRKLATQTRRKGEQTVSYEIHRPDCMYRSAANAAAFELPPVACSKRCPPRKGWCNILGTRRAH